jgi:acyl-CoA thioester hydrolase
MRFLESARMQYFEDVRAFLDEPAYRAFIDAREVGPILATASIAYKAPVTFPDTLTVGARVAEVQADRFRMVYAGVSHKTGRVVCDGDSWIVTYDYRVLRKAPLPAHIRAAMDAHARGHAQTHPPSSPQV